MITREQAINDLDYGKTIFHATSRNADGSPSRAKITGKIKLWKTRPNDFRIPWKHGLYGPHGYADQDTAAEWYLTESEAIADNGGKPSGYCY